MDQQETGAHAEPPSIGRMTPAQKWVQMVSLREMAWTLKAAYIRRQYPQLSEDQIEQKVRDIFLYAST